MNLKKKAFSATAWAFIDISLTKGITLGTIIYLARILSPQEVGLVGILTVFIMLSNSIIDGGMGISLIRTKQIDQSDLNTVFYANLLFSIVCYLTIYLVAPFIADFYDQEILANLIRVYALRSVFFAFTIVHRSILERNLDFKALTIISIPSNIISAILAILMVQHGYGVWSLVAMPLSFQATEMLLFFIKSRWAPQFSFSKDKLKYHFNFGYKLTINTALNAISQELITLITGKFFSIASVGYYTNARRLNMFPIEILSRIINKTTFPVLSKIQDQQEKISYSYRIILKMILLLIIPTMLLLGVIIEPLIVLLLTEKWLPSVPLFRILVFSGILIPIHAFNLNIFKIYGKTNLFLKIGIIKQTLLLITVIIGVQFGLNGLLICTTGLSYFALLINSYYSKKLINYSTKEQLLDMAPVFLTGLISYIIGLGFLEIVQTNSLIIQIVLTSLVFMFVFLIAIIIFNKKAVIELANFLKPSITN